MNNDKMNVNWMNSYRIDRLEPVDRDNNIYQNDRIDQTDQIDQNSQTDRISQSAQIEQDDQGKSPDSYTQAVTDIQRYLYTISRVNPLVPRVNPDGIYGPETEKAVSEFQKLYHILVTGKVDLETWNMLFKIYSESLAIINAPEMISPFSVYLKDGILEKGNRCDTVYIVQVMLDTLRIEFNSIPYMDITGYYGEDTEEAVRMFQKSFGLDVTGRIDLPTWNSMANSYNKYVKYTQ